MKIKTVNTTHSRLKPNLSVAVENAQTIIEQVNLDQELAQQSQQLQTL